MKFTSLLKNIIVENGRFNVLKDKLTTPQKNKEGKTMKPKLTLEELIKLVQADPTTRMNNVDPQSNDPKELEKIKAGSYTNWLIKSYLNPQTETSPGDRGYDREVKELRRRFIDEDLDKFTINLQKFDRFKNRLEERDINKYTPQTLDSAVENFSLAKTKATAEEKASAQETYEHPGAQIIHRGAKWTIAKISGTSELAKDAALWYGGYYLLLQDSDSGETKWCTSSPGLGHWEYHLRQGPLYVVIPNNWSGKRGKKTGLPAERYQFHFQSNQFMDVRDNPIQLVERLNGDMSELKDVFKPEFAKGLTLGGGTKVAIDNFSSGTVGKFIALYGIEDLIEQFPEDLEELQLQNKEKDSNIIINIPSNIDKFKKLRFVLLENCVDKIPDTICNCKNMQFMSIVNNPRLRTIPECIIDLPKMIFLNLKGCENVKIPPRLEKMAEELDAKGTGMWDFQELRSKND